MVPDASDVAELTDGHDVQPGFPEPGALSPPFREYPGFSPLRPHAEWLGTTTGEMLAGNGPAKVRLAGLTSRSLAEMRSDGRVRFTVNGVFGDPGTRSPRWIYCRPAALTELMADEQRYRDLIGRRWMARRESRLRAMLGFTLMTTTLTGIDNTSIMLPTLPNGAGEDAFLGEAVRFLDPGSMQIGMPWMLRHQPETPRHWSDADLAKPVTVNPGMFFRQQLADLAETARSDDAGARAGLLRSRLTDLAAAGPCELSSEIFSQVMSERCEIAGLLGRRANEAKLPGYLVGDYRRMIEAQTDSESMEDVVPAGASPTSGIPLPPTLRASMTGSGPGTSPGKSDTTRLSMKSSGPDHAGSDDRRAAAIDWAGMCSPFPATPAFAAISESAATAGAWS